MDTGLSYNRGMQQPDYCPLCRFDRTRFVDSVRNLDAHCVTDAPDLVETHSCYFVCEQCGTVFQYPPPTFDEMANYFKNTKVSDSAIFLDVKKDLFQQRLGFLKTHIGLASGRVVEVGCREGNFLKLLKDTYGYDVFGIDPSEHATQMARSVNNIDTKTATLESLDLKAEGLYQAFDLAYVMHAMEYVYEPGPFLTQLVQLIKPGGYLYLEVPYLGYPYETLICGKYIFRQQLSHFLGSGLGLFLKSLGITVTETLIDTGHAYPSFQVMGRKLSYAELGESLFRQELNHMNARYIEAGQKLSQLLTDYSQVALWGAGYDLHRVLTLMPSLIQPDKLVLIDENPNKQGKQLCGIPIHASVSVTTAKILAITPSAEALRQDILKDVQQRFPNVPVVELFAESEKKDTLNIV